MYEENLKPLLPGDATQAFASILAELQGILDVVPEPVSHEKVLFWADRKIQTYLFRISRRLLLPGSGIRGIESLQKSIDLVTPGRSCGLFLNHRSNLDVPTLGALLHDVDRQDLFDKIIWVAGRKLQEDPGLTGLLFQAFNRVIVTPRSWNMVEHTDAERREGNLINIAAHRVIHELRDRGWMFALFPTGTRMRPGDKSTMQAIPEIDSFIKSFEFLTPGHMEGCTMPVTREQDLTHETPRLNRVCFTFGQVVETKVWRCRAQQRFPRLTQRQASAQAIMEDISNLGHSAK